MSNAFIVPNNLLLAKDPQTRSGSGLPGASEYRASTLTQKRFTGDATGPVTIADAVQNGTRTLAAITNDGNNNVYINFDQPAGAVAGRTGVCIPPGGSLVFQVPFQFDGSLTANGDAAWSVTILEGVVLW